MTLRCLSPPDLMPVNELPSGVISAPPVHIPSAGQPFCGNIPDVNKTAQENATCEWNEDYGGYKENATNAEWTFGLDLNTTKNADDLVRYLWAQGEVGLQLQVWFVIAMVSEV